ncbi:hypothetical protein [Clostridium sp.]|uniref:hypothetical protein n=1 Tax=Clostridium sp. TaxID=1506 RepID=UPI0025C03341|nr:hypothetical protein [Clostridium sp.]
MKNINKALKISMALISISLVMTLLVLSKLKLDKPVFLKNYKEVEIMENEGAYSISGFDIELKYISNREDKRKVSSVIFKEAPELNFYASENNSMGLMRFYNNVNDNVENHGIYGVHTVFLSLSSQKYDYEFDKDLVLSNATVTFDDGLTMEVDLGKIILYKHDSDKYDYDKKILKWYSGQSSNDGISKGGFIVNDYIKVSHIYSPLFDDTKDLFDFNIDKLGNIANMELIYNKNDYLYFTSQFYNIDDIERKLYSYDIKPVIYFKDGSGNDHEQRINNLTYNPYFRFSDIYKYLRVKGEI